MRVQAQRLNRTGFSFNETILWTIENNNNEVGRRGVFSSLASKTNILNPRTDIHKHHRFGGFSTIILVDFIGDKIKNL